MAHVGKILLKIITRRLSDYCERLGILPKEQSGPRPNRSTTDMMFVIRRTTGVGAEETNPVVRVLHRSSQSVRLRRPNPPVGGTRPLRRQQRMISVIHQFHDDMRACMRLDDGMCSGWFAVEQVLRQGCVLALLLLNNFFAAVTHVTTRVSRQTKVS